jgi:carbon storage regulator CsrA
MAHGGTGREREISNENGGSIMLVLSRKQRESVVLGGSHPLDRLLKVTVLEIKGGRVRLGFEVEDDFPVHRWEVWERIRAGGQAEPEGVPQRVLPHAGLETGRHRQAARA